MKLFNSKEIEPTENGHYLVVNEYGNLGLVIFEDSKWLDIKYKEPVTSVFIGSF